MVMFFAIISNAQYPGPVGSFDCNAVHKDSSIIRYWADSIFIDRGYRNISDKSLGYADYGLDQDALGAADNQVVSLGDGGKAQYYLNSGIFNGPGPDFAVFENALNDEFLELAFVEVSSDGINFFRFPSVSLTSIDLQTGTFGLTDTRKINNLAGKFRVGYGTPFELDSLPDHHLLNKSAVSYIRIIDVVGSVNPEYASKDSHGNIINDPFPTPFQSGGFDLDALGLINVNPNNSREYTRLLSFYPSLVRDHIILNKTFDNCKVKIFNTFGVVVKDFSIETCNEHFKFDLSFLTPGNYFIRLSHNNQNKSYYTGKFIKL